MRLKTMYRSAVSAAALTALIGAAGCRIESNKHGSSEDVKMATPFGGMTVKTNDSVVASGIGLPVYPGATPIKNEEHGHSDGAADVDMSFGSFRMRIKAVSYHSDDSQDKVLAFYRPALAKFGDIIQCDHDRPVGTPTRTSQGLTCDDKKDNHSMARGSSSGTLELKTGSQQHQHIVAVEPQDGGTKIGLVALDLPGHLSFGDGDGSDSDKQ